MQHLQHVPAEAMEAQAARGAALISLEWEGARDNGAMHGALCLDGAQKSDTDGCRSEVPANIIVKLLAATLAYRDELNLREENNTEDPLTGVSNRHGFYRFALRADPAECAGVICCELSGIRKANRHAGHGAGDAALKELAHMLLENFRRPWVFRMGSSDFLVCCPGVQEDLFNRRVGVLLGILQAHEIPATVRTAWAADTQDGLEQLALQAMSASPRSLPSPTRHRHSHLWD
jgi:GGDEF domain-containing protein